MIGLSYKDAAASLAIKGRAFQADPTTLTCDFEKDFCHWTIEAETPFIFERKTGAAVIGDADNGPEHVSFETRAAQWLSFAFYPDVSGSNPFKKLIK